MGFKQNQHIDRGCYIKKDKNSTNLQGVKAITLKKMFSIINISLLAIIKTCSRSHVQEQNHLVLVFE